jgi:hypothetical protein
MLYFGGPNFYDKYVRGINFWPDFEKTHVSMYLFTLSNVAFANLALL